MNLLINEKKIVEYYLVKLSDKLVNSILSNVFITNNDGSEYIDIDNGRYTNVRYRNTN